MTLVRILKNWDRPDLMRQTPGSSGIWDGVRFTLDPVETCDYTIVLNRVPEPTTVRCPPQHVWAIMQEPPNEVFRIWHRGSASDHRVYTQDPGLRGRRYVHSQGCLAWHVNRTYDELVQADVPEKSRSLSWITSSLTVFGGHRARLSFLERLRNAAVEFDLYGRGFNYIEDKWDGLAPYRYALVVENFRNPHYWSEKIADALLAWALPIYYGCTRIHTYFPPEAVVSIDINDPGAIDHIVEVVASDRWQRSMDAIAYARSLVLERYQLFPFVTTEIRRFERQHGVRAGAETLTLTNQPRQIDQMRERIRHLRERAASRLRRTLTTLRQHAIWR